MGMEDIRAYVALAKEKRSIEANLAAVKQQLDDLEQPVYDYMVSIGAQNMRIDDMTVYLKKTIHATYLGTDEARQTLELLGLLDALTETVHASRASAIARELLDLEETDMRRAQLEKAFNIYEKFRVSVTR